MGKHLIVISVDAMVFEDIEKAKGLPSFKRLLEGASVIERVRTVYPSLTHTVHASILTGATPGKTGIVNNHLFSPKAPDTDNSVWYNIISEIRCDTLLHAAKRAGLTTASSTFPMTAYADGVVDYLVPGVLNYYYRDGVAPIDVYRELGASEELLPIIERAAELYGWRDRHPEIDCFQVYCATEIIKKFKPNLLLMHPGDVDHQRHATGVFCDGVVGALERTDTWLGTIMDAVDEAGIADSTDIVVLSDHGQINIDRAVSLNVALAERGYIRLKPDGTVDSWDAYVHSAGASAQVYLSRPEDGELKKEIYELLAELKSTADYGFERIFTTEELDSIYGLRGDFSFVLETDGHTSFGEWLCAPAERSFGVGDYRQARGTHGHSPEKGPQPPFIAKGPSFKSGVTLAQGSILNHAPTLARVLGIELADADGEAVEEILNIKE